jgi:hypothetical protein
MPEPHGSMMQRFVAGRSMGLGIGMILTDCTPPAPERVGRSALQPPATPCRW